MTVKEFINKAKYDPEGQWLWRIDKQGNLGRLVDLRGWESIQYLFPRPDKSLDLNKAAAFQDEVGQWITDAINEKLEREKLDSGEFPFISITDHKELMKRQRENCNFAFLDNQLHGEKSDAILGATEPNIEDLNKQDLLNYK